MSKTSRARKRGMRLEDLKLRVMAEYGSSGIWAVGRVGMFRHGMLEHADLSLSNDLAQRFDRWIQLYESKLSGEFDVDRFNHIGRELARDLKLHIGVLGHVEFIPELATGCLGEVEIIG
jgi:hypothetical protein